MNMNGWEPRKFKPSHLRVVYCYWSGTDPTTGGRLSNADIAARTGYSEGHVANILKTQEAQDILRELHQGTLDTMIGVEVAAQAVAPLIFDEKVRLALQANDERVRNSACSDVLNMAGHQPVKRISIERPDPASKRYQDKTDDELRALVRQEIEGKPASAPSNPTTVH